LFGPYLLPDADFRRDSIARPPEGRGWKPTDTSGPQKFKDQNSDGGLDSAEQAGAVPEGTPLEKAANSGEDTESASREIPSVCFGMDLLTGAEVRWPLTLKGNPHLLVAGLPGMGKTTFLLNLCKQMLAVGIRPIVFSYHEDIDEKLERLVDSVRFIDFRGLGFNPLQVTDRESRMAYLDVAGALRDIFVAIFPELGDIQAERIRKAIKDSFVEAGWDNPSAVLAQMHEPEFKRFVKILRDDSRPDRGLRMLLARLEELGDYGFFDVGESRESLWNSEQPIVIRVHTTQNDNLQRAFASLVFYSLYKDMFRRGTQDRITHAVVFDEAHRAAGLKLIPRMAKECRKFGISLVLASQEAKDFNVSVFSAIANYLVLRLTEADAKALVRNVASSQQERVLIDKIKQMDRFKALYFCEGKSRPSPVGLMP
jgi:DNA phosphorothioation-dependent restriction protein DptH